MTDRLNVLPAGTALVPDYESIEGGVLRFIGRRHDPSLGKNGGWVPIDGPVSVPYRQEYLQELKSGALLPADKETADLAQVPFQKVGG